MIGVTTDIAHGLTAHDVTRCGFTMARFVLRWKDAADQLAHFLHELQPLGIVMIGVVTSESAEPGMPVGAAAQAWLEWLSGIGVQLAYLQIGNEPDLESGSSMTQSHADFNALINEVARVWKGHSTLVGGGLAGGDPTWLSGVDQSALDMIAVHPYGQMPRASNIWRAVLPTWADPVEQFIARYKLFTKLPIAVTEYGGRQEELRGLWPAYYVDMSQTFETMMWDGTLALASCYGHSQAMVPGMGMLNPDGSFTPAGAAMASFLG